MKNTSAIILLGLLASCDGSSNNTDSTPGNGGGDPVAPPVTWDMPNTVDATVALGDESDGEVAEYRYELFVASDKIQFGPDCGGFGSTLPEFERIVVETPLGMLFNVGHKIDGGVEANLVDIFNNEGWVEYVVCYRNASTVTVRPDSYTVYIYSNELVELLINPEACGDFRSTYMVEILSDQEAR